MFNLFSKKKIEEVWLNPVKGEVIPIDQVEDEVFSSKMMGDGFAVRPESNNVFSPLDGTIMKVFKTKHALLIKGSTGLEVIVHVGLDTVELGGEGFEVHVAKDQKVKAGDKLITADLAFIQSKGKPITSLVVITNMELVHEFDVIYGALGEKEDVCKITRA